MQLGLSTAAFYGRWVTEEAAAQISALPVDCAEVFLQSQSEYEPSFARLVRSKLGDLPCTSIHPLGHHENFLIRRPQRQMADALDVFRRILDSGAALGAQTYVYHGRHTPQLSPMKWDLDWNIEALGMMCHEAAQRGMAIGWENVYWCQLTEPLRVLEAKKHLSQVKFTLDIKQAMRAGCDPIEFAAAMGDQLCNVHVCDWDANGKLCLPGEGVFDFDKLFDVLNETGYHGPVILEPYLSLIRNEESLLRSLDYLRSRMNSK